MSPWYHLGQSICQPLRQQEVLLSDFGLAALAHSSASLSTQEAIGTLPYLSAK